jgi:hypothetical protein
MFHSDTRDTRKFHGNVRYSVVQGNMQDTEKFSDSV